LREFLAHAREGLARLIAHFDDPATPYVPIPRPEIAPVFNDYEHLARVGEWWGTEAEP
jgi:ATP-dependent helicase/nuclease subunit B